MLFCAAVNYINFMVTVKASHHRIKRLIDGILNE
jgi:hypothetical protein